MSRDLIGNAVGQKAFRDGLVASFKDGQRVCCCCTIVLHEKDVPTFHIRMDSVQFSLAGR